MACILSELAHC
jgi:hypothetical protein